MIENSKQDIKIVSRDNVYAYDENGKRYIIRKGTRWDAVPNKWQDVYVPILTAFIAEMLRLNAANANVASNLILYLIGRRDFYKVIKRGTVVEVYGFNINNTLNRNAANGTASPINVQRLRLPTTIIQFAFSPGSQTTILLVCNHGWQISFRIHSAETLVIPSLKFDVQLIGHSPTIYSNHIPY